MPFEIVEREGVKAVVYPNFPVAHGNSTRVGGVSGGHYSSLNLSTSTGDSLENVQENRRRLGLGLGLNVLSRIKMVHGIEVATLDSGSPADHFPTADACITAEAGYGLSLTTADCIPILYFCPSTRAVGVAHAGWRGTIDGIASATAIAMHERLGCPLETLQVAIGPGIGPCCFEVGAEVAQVFTEQFNRSAWSVGGVVEPRRGLPTGAKFEIDLHETNRRWLLDAGVASLNINRCELCTSCHPELFFSHRRDRGLTGRLMTVIQTSMA